MPFYMFCCRVCDYRSAINSKLSLNHFIPCQAPGKPDGLEDKNMRAFIGVWMLESTQALKKPCFCEWGMYYKVLWIINKKNQSIGHTWDFQVTLPETVLVLCS